MPALNARRGPTSASSQSSADASARRAAARAAAAGLCLDRLLAALGSVTAEKLGRMRPATALHLAEKLARIYRDIEGNAVSLSIGSQLAVFLPKVASEEEWEKSAAPRG